MNIVLELDASQAEAERRLEGGRGGALKGILPRLDPRVRQALRAALSTFDRPNLSAVRRSLVARCREWGVSPPSRTTLYDMLEREVFHRYPVAELSEHVKAALYNIDLEGEIGGHQLAFYCFNYGSLPALSFGASLPWVDLVQALRMPGWRPKSKALLEAVVYERGQ